MMRTLIVGVAVLMLNSTFNGTGVAAAEQSTPPTAAPAPHDHDHAATDGPEAKAAPKAGMRMMAKMNATDAELNQLVTRMTAAEGDAKTALMADLLARLVQQHTSLRTQMDESMKTMMAQCSMKKDSSSAEQQPEH